MSDSNQHIVPYELLARYLSGDISENDRQAAEKWINLSPENQSTFNELKTTWTTLDKVQDLAVIDLESEWERQKNINRFKVIPDKNNVDKFPFWNASKIAAVFIVLFAAAFAIYYYGPYFRISRIVNDRDTKTVELSDGTIVTLNNNSSIKYPIRFKGDSREVSLTGEAYFEVSSDKNRPFIVNTDLTAIEVIGTAFNIRAYKEHPEIVVTVMEGKVAFYSNDKPEQKIFIEKNSLGKFNRKTGSFDSEPDVDPNTIAWKTRKIIFEKEPLEDAVSILKDVYNEDIKIENPGLQNCRITASFDQQSLESVLKVIASTLELEITQSETGYIIRGEGCE